MIISQLWLDHFRNFEQQVLKFDSLSLLVGPNSAGKSNVFRALSFFFHEGKQPRNLIYENLSAWRRDNRGGPGLSIYINVTFSGNGVGTFAEKLGTEGVTDNDSLEVKMRARRGGQVCYGIQGRNLTEDQILYLKSQVRPVLVPPIRDLESGGLEPFLKLLAQALRKGRGQLNLGNHQARVRGVLQTRAKGVLGTAQYELQRHMPGTRLVPNVSSVNLDELFDSVSLSLIQDSVGSLDLTALGTGHQSIVIMALHKALVQNHDGLTLFLVDEPASHLHPNALDVLTDELSALSENSQVIAATHSPNLVCRIGLRACLRIVATGNGRSQCRNISDTLALSDKQVAAELLSYQMRLAEPLFAPAVVLVEGAFDAVVVRKVSQLLGFGLPETRGILVVPVGDKHRISRLTSVLKQCGIDRVYGLFDSDAIYSGEPAIFLNVNALDPSAKDTLRPLIGQVSPSSKRARGCRKLLDAVLDEIENGPSPLTPYDGSPVSVFVNEMGLLSETQISELKSCVAASKKRRRDELLAESHAYVLNTTCDRDLFNPSGAEQTAARFYARPLNQPSALDNKVLVSKWTKKLANDPATLCDLLEELDSDGKLRRSITCRTIRKLMTAATAGA